MFKMQVFYGRYIQHRNNYWKHRNLPGPPPNFLFGNALDLTKPELPAPLQYVEWEKQYGKTYGIYDGFQKVDKEAKKAMLR